MRSSMEMYKEVAERCSAYDCKDCCRKDSHSNLASTKSCLNCSHFSDEEYCRLDLYDPIAREL